MVDLVLFAIRCVCVGACLLAALHRRDYERLRAWSVGQRRAAGVVEIVLFFA